MTKSIYKTHVNAKGESVRCTAQTKRCPRGAETPHHYYDEVLQAPTLPPAHHINSFIVNAPIDDLVSSYSPITSRDIYKDYVVLREDYDKTVEALTVDIKENVSNMASKLEEEVKTKGEAYNYINDFSIDEGRLRKLVEKNFDASLSESLAKKYVAMHNQEKLVRRLASSHVAQQLLLKETYPVVS